MVVQQFLDVSERRQIRGNEGEIREIIGKRFLFGM
jgi:hypothetical protein